MPLALSVPDKGGCDCSASATWETPSAFSYQAYISAAAHFHPRLLSPSSPGSGCLRDCRYTSRDQFAVGDQVWKTVHLSYNTTGSSVFHGQIPPSYLQQADGNSAEGSGPRSELI